MVRKVYWIEFIRTLKAARFSVSRMINEIWEIWLWNLFERFSNVLYYVAREEMLFERYYVLRDYLPFLPNDAQAFLKRKSLHERGIRPRTRISEYFADRMPFGWANSVYKDSRDLRSAVYFAVKKDTSTTQREFLLCVLFFIIRKTGLTTLLVGELSFARSFLQIS